MKFNSKKINLKSIALLKIHKMLNPVIYELEMRNVNQKKELYKLLNVESEFFPNSVIIFMEER
jgi:hypothetical protein